MKTLVFQSYRNDDVPGWLQRCMDTACGWATLRSYNYLRIGDELFDPVPDWFRASCGHRVLPVTDLARLLWIQKLLAEGWERVVWIDADVLIFDPANLTIPDDVPHALCRELWVNGRAGGTLVADWKLNNCFCFFRADSSLLRFYIDCCEVIARAGRIDSELALGPLFLTPLHQLAPLPLISTIGMFHPELLDDIVSDAGQFTSFYGDEWNGPLCGANLCRSLLARPDWGGRYDSTLPDRAVTRLLADRGFRYRPAAIAV